MPNGNGHNGNGRNGSNGSANGGSSNGNGKSNGRTGRPSKLPDIDLTKVEFLAGLGLTEKELGFVLGISVATIANYKLQSPDFLEAIKKGKARADMEVVRKLYERATGFAVTETTSEPTGKTNADGSPVMTVTKVVRKQVAPDTTAILFWLQNRMRDRWKNVYYRGDGGDLKEQKERDVYEELEELLSERGIALKSGLNGRGSR